ncbi:MAG: hypothetical protein JNN27_24330 [Planctomycetes bacterium]|nr:hypothetical protein [Planctomycetota bacterium]
MKRIFSSRWFWIAIAVLVLVGLAVLVVLVPELLKPVLWTVLAVGIGWALTEVGLRVYRKRKRRAFDEGLTAKEGIEDRKREWDGFVVELEKQKIDRYELPFYLLVGEPQSGKSVLLQNSDLHFPFGQNKLSGIGGTRGCDWWFTEEAVILDLAGRLFTHEGGVADQLEWEAFLKLLVDFRPLCPANGILLVVPCDSLLGDAPDLAKSKANKIQGALLTLANQLEAQLPIYVVLTKADKLFGFAESVHRLDANKRHEMFGWSRGAEKVDAPFDIEEARLGFSGMVQRARALRAQMLASAHIPEALGEVDRLYAFPEELAALFEPLEIYLRRVFTESSLEGKLTFRGLYLTSGLQSGVPMARACASVMGSTNEADQRDLEALFTKQRAYFIKDLVRSRVFGERGLVRPTKGRALAAQKQAMVGYGVSGVIALGSIIAAITYLAGGSGGEVNKSTQTALELARDLDGGRDWAVPRMLESLYATRAAIQAERVVSEEIWNSTREDLKQLYVAEFDHRLAPRLRERLLDNVRELAAAKPADHDELLALMGRATLLLGELDFSNRDAVQLVESALPQAEREFNSPSNERFTLTRAIEARLEYGGAAVSPAPPGAARSIDEAAKLALDLVDECLTPGVAWQPRGGVGYMVAWLGIARLHEQLSNPALQDERASFAITAQFVATADALTRAQRDLEPLTQSTFSVKATPVKLQFRDQLGEPRERLAALLAQRQAVGRVERDWRAHQDLFRFIDAQFAGAGKNISAEWSFGARGGEVAQVAKAALDEKIAGWNGQLEVPTSELSSMLDASLIAACKAKPNADWSIATLGADVAAAARELRFSERSKLAYVAKLREAGRQFAERCPNWKALGEAQASAGAALEQNELARSLVEQLSAARAALAALDAERTAAFCAHLDSLLAEHFEHLDKNWRALLAAPDATEAPTLAPAVLDTLAAAAERCGASTAQRAKNLMKRYADGRQELLVEYWRQLPEGGAHTKAMLQTLGEHFALVKQRFGVAGDETRDGLDGAWIDDVERCLIERLQQHEAALRAYWRPPQLHGQAGLSLSDAAAKVKDKLSRSSIEDLIKGLDEVAQPPPLDDPLFAKNSAVFLKLERAGKALEALRGLKAPANGSALSRSPYVEWLTGVADGVMRTTSGADLAVRIFEIDSTKRADQDVPPNGGGAYARALWDTLRLRLVDEVKLRYGADLRELLDENRELVDALYTTDFTLTRSKFDESALMQRLYALLNRKSGKFDQLQARYKAVEIGLAPPGGPDAPTPADPVLATQRFLMDLQTFFLGADGRRVEDGSVKVALKPRVGQSLSIWDPNKKGQGWRESFYAPIDALGGWEYENVDADMPEKILEWSFRADSGKKLRMRWNDTPSGAREFEPGDAKVEIYTSLAPLLLAWSGEKTEGGLWLVTVQPEDARLPAPFELRFLDRDLPVRPQRLE